MKAGFPPDLNDGRTGMQDPTPTAARSASQATLDLVEALERAADVLRRSLTAAAGEVVMPTAERVSPAMPADFALAMRRVEAEYYDAA
jgi:hypothetical protein